MDTSERTKPPEAAQEPLEYVRLLGYEFQPTPELKRIPQTSWVNNPQHWWWVAMDRKDRVVGVVGLTHLGNALRFKSDAVLPEYRGRGIYRTLTVMRFNWAMDTDVQRFTAFASPMSRPMFLKLGFKPEGEVKKGDIQFMAYYRPKKPKSW